jgi:hypothetical protein
MGRGISQTQVYHWIKEVNLRRIDLESIVSPVARWVRAPLMGIARQ